MAWGRGAGKGREGAAGVDFDYALDGAEKERLDLEGQRGGCSKCLNAELAKDSFEVLSAAMSPERISRARSSTRSIVVSPAASGRTREQFSPRSIRRTLPRRATTPRSRSSTRRARVSSVLNSVNAQHVLVREVALPRQPVHPYCYDACR